MSQLSNRSVTVIPRPLGSLCNDRVYGGFEPVISTVSKSGQPLTAGFTRPWLSPNPCKRHQHGILFPDCSRKFTFCPQARDPNLFGFGSSVNITLGCRIVGGLARISGSLGFGSPSQPQHLHADRHRYRCCLFVQHRCDAVSGDVPGSERTSGRLFRVRCLHHHSCAARPAGSMTCRKPTSSSKSP